MPEANRSVREHLGRETRLYLLTAAVGWLIFVGCIFVPTPAPWLMIGAFVATCGALVALLVFIRCPQCRAPLPQVGFAAAVAPTAARRHANCPACGAALD